MSPQTPLGQLIQSFFLDHLIAVKDSGPHPCAATATRSGY